MLATASSRGSFKEVVKDTSSVSQAVNVASDDDEDDQEGNTPLATYCITSASTS